ncbi:MAG: asparagine synthetase B family protein [Rhizomicrobium sp.]
MCGIAVAIDWEGAEQIVPRLLAAISHRGDVTDPIVSPRAKTAMGTRRLRIVDMDRAVQPQASFDGRLLLSFNGEIYNHAELREQLKAKGVPFHTESDTEVLANALQVWGVKALAMLNGMYAFVAFDVSTGEFLAARDPFGVKPLYVMQSGEGFLFCSEMRPLLSNTETGDVLLLPPGYVLTRKICAGYKTAVGNASDATGHGDIAKLDALLADAVHIRLPQELPVAIKLSGGIDSTLVAHYARSHRPDAPGYFLGAEDAPDFRYVSEYARVSGIDLRLVPFAPESSATLARIGEVVAVSESFEPAVIRGAVCSHILSEAIHRDGFRVSLCGEGADELFAGYVPIEWAFACGQEQGRIVRDQCLEQMHAIVLQRVDRCSMRFTLETREPFLDPRVARYALDLRGDVLVDVTGAVPRGKQPLRALYDLYPGQLPASIRDRTKVLFDEGAGLDLDRPHWANLFEEMVSDREFRDGRRQYEAYGIQTKEELIYLRALAGSMDIGRVPHLRGRLYLDLPPGVEAAMRNAGVI